MAHCGRRLAAAAIAIAAAAKAAATFTVAAAAANGWGGGLAPAISPARAVRGLHDGTRQVAIARGVGVGQSLRPRVTALARMAPEPA